MDPEEAVSDAASESMAENVFGGDLPLSEPLNDEIATIGYDNTAPLAEVGTVSVIFMINVGLLVLMLLAAFCHNKIGSMASERVKQNFESFALWGSILDVILMAYLPVCVAMFVSTVGMQWQETNGSVVLSNMWTIFMLHAWILCPIFLFIVLFRNRKNIGIKTQPCEEPKEEQKEGEDADAEPKEDKNLNRDPMKMKWLLDYAKIIDLKKKGLSPEGIAQACRNRKVQADAGDRVQPLGNQNAQQQRQQQNNAEAIEVQAVASGSG